MPLQHRAVSRRVAKVTLLLIAIATPPVVPDAWASRAVVPPLANQVTWRADGTIEATVYETEAVAGPCGNFSVNLNQFATAGQTFRCAGPRLAAVQMGLDSADTDCDGLKYRLKGKDRNVAMTILLREGGPNGPVVARKTFAPDKIKPDMLLKVDRPSRPTTDWYVEVSPSHRKYPNYKVYMYSTRQDTYRPGRLYLAGKATDGDLQMRITGARPMRARRPGKAVFWAARPEEHIWMDPDKTIGLMLADRPDRPVSLAAARNELVSYQFAVTPRPDYRVYRAALSVAPFSGPGGARIGAKNIRIEWLRYSHDFNRGKSSGRLYPDPLAPTATADSLMEEPDRRLNRSFWVSIRIPRGIPAGVYTSTATVRVNEELTLRRPIRLEVFDVDLPRETHTRTGLFRSIGRSTEHHLWWVSDMADFRIAQDASFYTDINGIQHQMKFSSESYPFILGPLFQQSLVETGKLLNRRGLAVGAVTPWGDTYRLMRGQNPKAAREGIIRFWKTYYPILKKHGWVDQTYCRVPDEVIHRELDKTRDIVRLFREHAPGVKIMVTEMNAADSVEALSKAIGIADIWCQNPYWMFQTLDFYKQRMAKGEEVWPYIHLYLATNIDPVNSRLFFWMLQKYGFSGCCYFSVKRAHFRPAWHGVRRSTDTFPGDGDLYYGQGLSMASNHGLWRSVRLYRIADGMEDREYFWLMNDLAQKAAKRGRLTDQMKLRVAGINAMVDEVVVGLSSFTHDMARVDQIRRELAGAIVALRKALR